MKDLWAAIGSTLHTIKLISIPFNQFCFSFTLFYYTKKFSIDQKSEIGNIPKFNWMDEK